jgi:NAD(P)-dependent dehydrogenase (short-subunit alcohol dehydrogenase family)
VTQAFAPLMAATVTSAVRPGRIVNISSVAGKVGGPFLGPHHNRALGEDSGVAML